MEPAASAAAPDSYVSRSGDALLSATSAQVDDALGLFVVRDGETIPIPTGGGGPTPPGPGVFLPEGWDDHWQAALAGAGSAPARVAAIGDSITRGYFASLLDGTGWLARVRANLQAARATAAPATSARAPTCRRSS